MTEAWLTKRELAAALKISPRTVERLRLPHMPVGGQNRYYLSEVEGYLRGGGLECDNVVPLRRPERNEAA